MSNTKFKICNLKNNKGIVVTDAIIAILIVLIFAGTVISLISKITSESIKLKMNSQQISVATQIFEYAEKTEYNDVTNEKLIQYTNQINPEKLSAGESLNSLTTPNKVKISVETYKPQNAEETFDIVKIITLTIENELDGKTYTTEISRLKKVNLSELKEIVEK